MSLITRCPSCGTLFKVVPDQLRISDGWVRCGHCAEIFDAYAQMQEAWPQDNRDAPETVFGEPDPDERRGPLRLPDRSPAQRPAPAAPESAFPRSAVPESPAPEPAPAARAARPSAPPQAPSVPASASLPASPSAGPVGAKPLAPPSGWSEDEMLDIQLDELLRVDVTPEVTADAAALAASPIDAPPRPPARERDGERERHRSRRRKRDAEAHAEEPSASPDAAADLAFVRAARRRSRWRSPWVRALLGLLALTLTTLLAAQVAVQERDRIAALEPRLRPVLEALCEPLACRIQPPRLLDTVAIDGVVFTRLLPDVFQFAFTLRSSAAHEVATPAIELTLTDRQEQVLVRRVVRPAEMRAPAALAARGEWSGSVRLALDPAAAPERVTGYRVLAFHP